MKLFKKVLPITIILIGVVLACVPILGNIFSQAASQSAIDGYNQTVSDMTDSEVAEAINDAETFNETGNSNYYDALNIDENGVIGYIEIPTINAYLPIYDSTSEDVLEKGIGHLENTSLPVGGKGTNCVLSGHSGLTTRKLFTDLDKLQSYDKFIVHTLGKEYKYKVVNIVTVLPEEVVSHIGTEPDKDYCTLMTCTPIGINTERLLVTGERIDD